MAKVKYDIQLNISYLHNVKNLLAMIKKIHLLIKKYANALLKATSTKYFVVLLLAGIWMVFFDRYRLISRAKVSAKIEQLKADKRFYERSLSDLEYQSGRLTERQTIERIAREKYFMKRNNEDIFVIVEE